MESVAPPARRGGGWGGEEEEEEEKGGGLLASIFQRKRKEINKTGALIGIYETRTLLVKFDASCFSVCLLDLDILSIGFASSEGMNQRSISTLL